jgi:hypothetical protein
MARQANSAHHIGIEEAIPIAVGDHLERLGLEDAETVHENVGIAGTCQKVRHPLGGSEIGGDCIHSGARHAFREAFLRGCDAARAAPVNHHRRTRGGEAERDREPDPGRRPRDNGSFAAEIDDHAELAHAIGLCRRWETLCRM